MYPQPQTLTPSDKAKKQLFAKTLYARPKEETTTDWATVEKYLPLVKSIVARMRIHFPEHIEKDDIYSIAIIGLISAVRNFDPLKGSSFGTYAKLRIRGALLDELRRMDWLSRDARSSTKQYTCAVNSLESKLARTPSIEEIASELGISSLEVSKLNQQRIPLRFIPLDGPQGAPYSSNAPLLHEIIDDPTQPDSRDIAENKDIAEKLQESLLELDTLSQKVLVLYYLEDMRLAEIALSMNLSESRICQIHGKALASLRLNLQKKIQS